MDKLKKAMTVFRNFISQRGRTCETCEKESLFVKTCYSTPPPLKKCIFVCRMYSDCFDKKILYFRKNPNDSQPQSLKRPACMNQLIFSFVSLSNSFTLKDRRKKPFLNFISEKIIIYFSRLPTCNRKCSLALP